MYIFLQPVLVAPDGFRVGEDFFRREPKRLHFSLAMQPSYIVKVG